MHSGRFLESHWVYEDPRKFLLSMDFASITSKDRFCLSLQRPIATRIIDQLGGKKVSNEALSNGITVLSIFYSKLFCFMGAARRQIFVHYISME